MRLAFMGAPDFAVPTLRAVAAAHEVAGVYTQPPRPAGRGKRLRPTPVQEAAEALGLSVRAPATLRDADAQAALAALELDAAVVVAYGLILPQQALDAPRLGCWNLHASLLPRWRGAAPAQRAIMAGDAETGVCVMRMEAGLDTGPVAACARTPIGPEEDAGALLARLAAMGAPLMLEALAALERGALRPTPQPADGATYAAKIDKAEARVDWTRPADELDRLARGLSPAPGAFTLAGGARLKLRRARPEPGAGAPGEILDAAGLVACGEGALRLAEAQREGKRVEPGPAALAALGLKPGDRLGE
jgi:methionyl-tRNA formyltransferase